MAGACLFLAQPALRGAPTMLRTPEWEIFEVVLHAGGVPANPFTDAHITATVVDPGGTTRTVDGFYDGDGKGGQTGDVWKLRFSPDRTGVWRWTTHSNLPKLDGRTGRFACVPGPHPGPIMADGHVFRRADGPPVYLPKGGRTAVLLPPGTYHVLWFNPRVDETPEQTDGGRVRVAEGKHAFVAPDTRDWVLHLRRVPAK